MTGEPHGDRQSGRFTKKDKIIGDSTFQIQDPSPLFFYCQRRAEDPSSTESYHAAAQCRWGPSLKLLGTGTLLQTLQQYDKDNIPPRIIAKIRQEIQSCGWRCNLSMRSWKHTRVWGWRGGGGGHRAARFEDPERMIKCWFARENEATIAVNQVQIRCKVTVNETLSLSRRNLSRTPSSPPP
jgi:hypothetical protein